MKKHRVCLLAYDGMPFFEFGIAVELFGLDRPEMGENWYEFDTASLDTPPLRSTAGVSIVVNGGLERLKLADTIIISGWPFRTRATPPELMEAIKSAHKRGTRLFSICSGAFLLAEAGLLDGLSATTHWKYSEEFGRLYPQVNFKADVLYCDEGQIMTSAGSAAGIDLGLHMIRKDFGPEAVNKVACRLIVPPHRDGGQAQYIRRAVPLAHESERLSPLLEYLHTRLSEPHTVKTMSKRVGMSERTFLRRFEELTGLTPARWLLKARLKSACDLLELQDWPIEVLAEKTGLGTATNLRHHFRAQLNTTPTSYRQTFGRLQKISA